MGVINVIFQDSQHLVEVGMQVAFYATPIIYKADMLGHGRLAHLLDVNPASILLNLIRDPILYGRLPSRYDTLAGMVCALVAVTVATAVLARFEKKMIFYL